MNSTKDIKITFDILYDILRNEKNKEELQELDSLFYLDVWRYIKKKREILESKKNDDDLFVEGQKEQIEMEIKNIKRVAKEIFEKRQKKIIDLALNISKTGTNLIDKKLLLHEEKKFLDDITHVFTKYTNNILHNILNEKEPERVVKVEVEFLQDVPAFIGREGQILGPFKKTDKEYLDEKIVNILEKMEKIRRVQ